MKIKLITSIYFLGKANLAMLIIFLVLSIKNVILSFELGWGSFVSFLKSEVKVTSMGSSNFDSLMNMIKAWQ